MAETSKPAPRANALLDNIRNHPQLPGLGTHISRIVAIADSETESLQELRDVILADVHLTQRILAIANSVGYRVKAGAGVSTISKAIVTIGFEQVKLIALGMMFVDQIPEPDRAVVMKAELIQALQASLLAREMSRQLTPEDREKSGIAALLGGVARPLLVMVDFERFKEIEQLRQRGISEAAASNEVLGIAFDTLTKWVLTFWGLPDTLVGLSTGAESKQSPRLARIVKLAEMTARHLRRPPGAERDALIADVRRQCLADGGVTGEMFDRWMAAADTQLQSVLSLFRAGETDEAFFPEGTVIDAFAPIAGPRDAVGKPANSRELILSRLQDVTDLIARGEGLSATLRAALECLHSGFGYSRSILLLREAGTTRIRARLWCGDVTTEQANRLEIDIATPADLFAEAVRQGSDLQIQNTRDPKISPRLPAYFTKACPQTSSFVVLPIVSGDSAIACILVGRDVAETEPIGSEDISLLRAVRSQIILAMKTIR
jgi:HD-like signal output (HDOD) protein